MKAASSGTAHLVDLPGMFAMSYFLTVTRPSNGLCLGMFDLHPDYYYRLSDGNRLRLLVDYAWCHRCERFVEAERLYSLDEIQHEIDKLSATQGQWANLDADVMDFYAKEGREMPREFIQQVRYDTWVTAFSWRRNRKTPPRCLRCGSFFAIKFIPRCEVIPHPRGDGSIVLQLGGHASQASFPDPVYFNEEGIQLA